MSHSMENALFLAEPLSDHKPERGHPRPQPPRCTGLVLRMWTSALRRTAIRGIGIAAVVLSGVAWAADPAVNPFDRVALEDASGRFVSADGKVRVHLRPREGQLVGTLLFEDQHFTVTASLKDESVRGEFTDGHRTNSFTCESDGQTLVFKTGSAKYVLVRQPFKVPAGTYESARVWLRLEADPNGFKGLLKFQGKAYPVAAQMVADELQGTFTSGDQAFPFTVSDESGNGALRFQAAAFRDTLQAVPSRCDLTVVPSPATGFTLTIDGQEATLENGVYRVPTGRAVMLSVRAPGFREVRTTRTFPAEGQETWEVPLVATVRVNSLGMQLTEVPGTEVLFSIYETRVQDYAAFANETRRKWDKPSFIQATNHPAVFVSWEDARAFCDWLTRKERTLGALKANQCYRLPTDAEWSRGVGLEQEVGITPQGKDGKIKDVYPWGNQWPPPANAGNYDDFSDSKISGFHDGFERTAPVASFASNPFGLYDMGGNVWEWCDDWYSGEQEFRVLRGGAWNIDVPVLLISSARFNLAPGCRFNFIGFRVVLAATPATS